MTGRDIRLSQIFNPASGRAFVVAFDHGQALPIPHGLGNPVALLGKIIDGGCDGILLTRGMLEQASHLFAVPGAPAPILRADWAVLDPSMKDELGEAHRVIVSPEQALELGASAVCMYLIARPETEGVFFDNLQAVATYVGRAHQLGLPVIVEAVLWGKRNTDKKDPELLRQICRVAAEIGADALKTEYVGDVAAQATVIEEAGNIPVLTLGGSADTREAVVAAARGAVEAGARGLIFGRNVWQVDDMSAVMTDLNGVVHELK